MTAPVLPTAADRTHTAALGIALIGCGRWGANHARAAIEAEGVTLVGVVESDKNRREAASLSYGVTSWASLSDALDDPAVEAVVIATPAPTHAALAHAALNGGRHVLIEKPAATSRNDAERLIDLAAAKGLQLSAGHTFLYAQPLRNAATWIRNSAPSRPWMVRSERLGGRRRPDCDVLWNLAPHDISILLHLMDEPVVEVSARAHIFPGGQLWDAATLDLYFASGARGEVYVGWRHPGAKRSLRVLAEGWSLTYRHGKSGDFLTATTNHDQQAEKAALYRNCVRDELDGTVSGYPEPLRVELEEFAHACREKHPTVTGPDHLLSVTSVLEACARSAAASGKLIRL